MTFDPDLPPPSRRSGAVAAAAATLRDLIVKGKLLPGTTLIGNTLATRLGVGRSTVRSALHLLEREGYVVSTDTGKYTRAMVAPLTAEDMQELHEIVGALNAVAARRAALLPREERGRLADELVEIDDLLVRLSHVDPPDVSALYEADERFHRRCVDAAGSRRLHVLYEAHTPQNERYGRLYAIAVPGQDAASSEEHHRIIDAIRRGDPDDAELATMTNFLNAAERFRRVIDRVGEGGAWL